MKYEVLVVQSCPTLCGLMDCSLLDFSIHGILQARLLVWVAIPCPGALPDPGIKPGSPALQADSLPSEPPGKPQIYVYVQLNHFVVHLKLIQHCKSTIPQYKTNFLKLLCIYHRSRNLFSTANHMRARFYMKSS